MYTTIRRMYSHYAAAIRTFSLHHYRIQSWHMGVFQQSGPLSLPATMCLDQSHHQSLAPICTLCRVANVIQERQATLTASCLRSRASKSSQLGTLEDKWCCTLNDLRESQYPRQGGVIYKQGNCLDQVCDSQWGRISHQAPKSILMSPQGRRTLLQPLCHL